MAKAILGGTLTALKCNVNIPPTGEFRTTGETLKNAGERKHFSHPEMQVSPGALTGREPKHGFRVGAVCPYCVLP